MTQCCPLRIDDDTCDCVKEKCAWWHAGTAMCGLLLAAGSLRILSSDVARLADTAGDIKCDAGW